jgi:hypothetical protein
VVVTVVVGAAVVVVVAVVVGADVVVAEVVVADVVPAFVVVAPDTFGDGVAARAPDSPTLVTSGTAATEPARTRPRNFLRSGPTPCRGSKSSFREMPSPMMLPDSASREGSPPVPYQQLAHIIGGALGGIATHPNWGYTPYSERSPRIRRDQSLAVAVVVVVVVGAAVVVGAVVVVVADVVVGPEVVVGPPVVSDAVVVEPVVLAPVVPAFVVAPETSGVEVAPSAPDRPTLVTSGTATTEPASTSPRNFLRSGPMPARGSSPPPLEMSSPMMSPIPSSDTRLCVLDNKGTPGTGP